MREPASSRWTFLQPGIGRDTVEQNYGWPPTRLPVRHRVAIDHDRVDVLELFCRHEYLHFRSSPAVAGGARCRDDAIVHVLLELRGVAVQGVPVPTTTRRDDVDDRPADDLHRAHLC